MNVTNAEPPAQFYLSHRDRPNSPRGSSLDIYSIKKYFINEPIVGISPGGAKRRDEIA